MWIIVLSFGALQGFFLAFVLFIHKLGNRRANRILAFLLLLLSFNVVRYLSVEYYNLSISFPLYIGLQTIPFLYGPLLYLYAEVSFKRNFTSIKYFVHFIPSLLLLLFTLSFLAESISSKMEFIISNYPKNLRIAVYLLFFVRFLHMLFYNMMILKSIKNLAQVLKQTRSNLKEISNRWFKYLLKGYTIFLSLMLLYFLLLISGIYYSYGEQIRLVFALIITFFIHAIAFKTLINPEIISENIILLLSDDKYKNSHLTIENRNKYQTLLADYMTRSKPYHNSELKLNELAKNLSIQPYNLSQVINEQYKMNFFDFINTYRVDEAKHKLCNSATNETILSIAFSVGFNSKTAFNRAFKKNTQMTPSQFKRVNQ